LTFNQKAKCCLIFNDGRMAICQTAVSSSILKLKLWNEGRCVKGGSHRQRWRKRERWRRTPKSNIRPDTEWLVALVCIQKSF
jgi:hypothetical protein